VQGGLKIRKNMIELSANKNLAKEFNIIKTMTDETMTEKILRIIRSIKELIKGQEGLQKKIKRMTEEQESIRKDNFNLKKRVAVLESMIIVDSDN
jgi:hypothetical protein